MSTPFLKLEVERSYGEDGTYIGDECSALVAKLYKGQEHYAPLFAASPELLERLREAAESWTEAFDGPQDEPADVDGGDLVEWFDHWRRQVKATLAKLEGKQ